MVQDEYYDTVSWKVPGADGLEADLPCSAACCAWSRHIHARAQFRSFPAAVVVVAVVSAEYYVCVVGV